MRLPFRRAAEGRVPTVYQVEASDCGAACLTAALHAAGAPRTTVEVRQVLEPGRDGVSLADVARAAKGFGCTTRALRYPDRVAAAPTLRPGAILHWGGDHFVVFRAWRHGRAHVMDPAVGRRSVALDQLTEWWNGVALSLERAPGTPEPARRVRPNPPAWWEALKHIVPRRLVLKAVGITALLQLVAITLPLMIKAVTDWVVPGDDRALLDALSLGFAAVAAGYLALTLLRATVAAYLRITVGAVTNITLVRALTQIPFRVFNRKSLGDLSLRAKTGDILRYLMTEAAVSALVDCVLTVTNLTLLMVINRQLGLIAVGFVVVYIGIAYVVQRAVSQAMFEVVERRADAENSLIQMLTGMRTLHLVGGTRYSLRTWERHQLGVVSLEASVSRLMSVYEAATLTMRFLAPGVILLWGARAVIDGTTTLGAVTAALYLTQATLVPLGAALRALAEFSVFPSYAARMTDILSYRAPAEDGTDPGPLAEIKVADVRFGYTRREPILHGVDLTIRRGDVIAVVGESGAGKTSLGMVLAGLYEPTEGSVTVNGTDVRELGDVWRGRIGFVDQDCVLFPLSIRDNILLGATASDDVVREAARFAAIDGDIEAMPRGYDTFLLNGGTTLSGGQRQRIAIARALVRRPELLILDEATSAIDPATEDELLDRLRGIGVTQLWITHRQSVATRADAVYRLSEGRLRRAPKSRRKRIAS